MVPIDMAMRNKFVIGIDEAGRGPLAGPVAVAVFGIKKGLKIKNFPPGKDSKKMTPNEREYWFNYFKKEKKKRNIFYKVCFTSSDQIDQKGIVFCIQQAIEKGLIYLNREINFGLNIPILLDGLLKAPEIFTNQKTIIKGDEKIRAIACASIVAKVSRDRLMKKLGRKFPDYGFERHKGYGTLLHRQNILKFGICDIHRRSYIRVDPNEKIAST